MLKCNPCVLFREIGTLCTEVGMTHFDRMMLLVGSGLVLIGAGAILLRYEADVVAFVTGTPVVEAPPEAPPLAVGQEVSAPLPEALAAEAAQVPAEPETTPPIDGAALTEPMKDAGTEAPAPEALATPEPEPAAGQAPAASRFPFFPNESGAGEPSEVDAEAAVQAEPEPVTTQPAPEKAAAEPETVPTVPDAPADAWSRTVLEMKPALRQPEPGPEAAAP
jgi:hypothetical protein